MTTVWIIAGLMGAIWIALTVFVDQKGPEKVATIGDMGASYKALIIYDPDPIYNLDEKICRSFAEGLAPKDWNSKIVTVTAANGIEAETFDLYVICANTYNWSPDKAIRNYIKGVDYLKGKRVVAITLGSGSTKRSQRILEDLLQEKQALLVDSRSFWLMKPNDPSHSKSSNIKVAVEMANTFGKEIAENIKN